jgi:hypothetical protein
MRCIAMKRMLLLAALCTFAAPFNAGGVTTGGATGRLAGIWRFPLDGGGYQRLQLNGHHYAVWVVPSDKARGSINVTGHTITFFGSNTCPGAGTYRFSITRGVLRFSLISNDPCPRAGLFPAQGWMRA